MPDLSDLSFPMRIRQGRAAAGLAVFLLASGGEPEPGRYGYGERLYGAIPLTRLLDRLAEEGRTERYWEAALAATDAVLAEGIDYPQRRSRIADPALTKAATAVAPADSRLPSIWLVEHWACISAGWLHQPRLSTISGPVEEFDREYGAALARAIEQHLLSEAG